MSLPIDIEASIRYKRILYRRTPEWWSNSLLYFPFRVFIVLFPPFALYVSFGLSPDVLLNIILIPFLFVCSVLVDVGGTLAGVLVEIDGVHAESERAFLEKALQKRYPEFRWNAEQPSSVYLHSGFFFDRRLIFLQRGDSVYINFTTFGRGEWVLFSMGITNYYRCCRIRSQFREYCARGIAEF